MENETLIEKAVRIATQVHCGQVDKCGAPYIGHPLRVMEMGRNEDECILGVLHDVVEDGATSFEDLLAEGFPPHIIDALRCITKLSPDEPYDKFIARVKRNPLAVAVKLNDLTDNMDIRRLPYLSDKDIKRLKRYLKAYKRLKGIPVYSVEATRMDYPNAYNQWSGEDDALLARLVAEGVSLDELSVRFGRKRSAIQVRMKKLCIG